MPASATSKTSQNGSSRGSSTHPKGGSRILKGVPQNILHRYGVEVCDELLMEPDVVAPLWSKLEVEAKKYRNPHHHYTDYDQARQMAREFIAQNKEGTPAPVDPYQDLSQTSHNLFPGRNVTYARSYSQDYHSAGVHDRSSELTPQYPLRKDELKDITERIHLDKTLSKEFDAAISERPKHDLIDWEAVRAAQSKPKSRRAPIQEPILAVQVPPPEPSPPSKPALAPAGGRPSEGKQVTISIPEQAEPNSQPKRQALYQSNAARPS